MKNAEYWRSRFALLEAGTHEKSDRYLAALEKVYQETAISVQKEIDAWYGRFAKNNQISLSDAKKWLSTKEREEFRWTVEQYIKIGKQKGLSADWLRKLENASTKFHISRLEAVQMQIQQQMELLFGNQVDELDMLLREVVSEGYTKGAFKVKKGIGLGWDLTTIPQNKLDLLLEKPWTNDGKTFRDRCWSDKSNLIEGIQKALIQGMLRGDGLQKTSAVIQKQFGVAQWKAARLVHTETTYFNAVARKQMYQDFKIKQMEIVETLDSHTCTICRPLDGTVLTISQYEPGVTVPPFHPHCRGTTCPYYADMEGVRTARSKDGTVYHVPDDMTYEDWKKSFLNGGKKDGLTPETERGMIRLTDQELWALNEYISSGSYKINEPLREGLPLTEEQKAFIESLDMALKKMPIFEGTVYRSLDSSIMADIDGFWKQYEVGKEITYPAYTSVSTCIFDETMDIQIVIQSKYGRDIRYYNSEELEIIFLRDTKFCVKRVDGNIIYLEEVI